MLSLLDGQADFLQGKPKSLVSRTLQLARPTGSTGVACGPLNLFQFYQFEIYDQKKACSTTFLRKYAQPENKLHLKVSFNLVKTSIEEFFD